MAQPNPDDGLMQEIAEQFVQDRAAFEREAAACTSRHARSDLAVPDGEGEAAAEGRPAKAARLEA